MGKIDNNKQMKRESLLDSAFSLFIDNGFNKTSISDIVNNAGVVHDVRNRGFIKAVVDKERESRVQKGLTFHLFVIINFSHRESPFMKDIKSVCHYLVYNYRYHTWKLSKGK